MSQSEPELGRDDLQRSVISIGSQLVLFTMTLGQTALLARLVSPAWYGVIAWVTPFSTFISLLADWGLGSALMSQPHLTSEDARGWRRRTWRLSAITLCVALLLALSFRFVGVHAFTPTAMLVLSLAAVLTGVSSIPIAILNRALQTSRVAWIDNVSAFAGLVVSCAAAIAWGDSPWPLLAGPVAASIMRMGGAEVMLHASRATAYLSHSDARPGAAASDTQRRGLQIVGFQVANHLHRTTDNLLIGSVHGAEALGYYARAYNLAQIPNQLILGPMARVAIATLARAMHNPATMRASYRLLAEATLALAFPSLVWLTVVGSPIVEVMLGTRWEPSKPLFTVLLFAMWSQPVLATIGWLYVAEQRERQLLRWGLLASATTVLAFAAGLPWGALGVAVAYALVNWLFLLPVGLWMGLQDSLVTLRDVAAALVRPTLAAALGAGAAALAMRLVPGGAVTQLAVASCGGLVGVTAGLLGSAMLRVRLIHAWRRWRMHDIR